MYVDLLLRNTPPNYGTVKEAQTTQPTQSGESQYGLHNLLIPHTLTGYTYDRKTHEHGVLIHPSGEVFNVYGYRDLADAVPEPANSYCTAMITHGAEKFSIGNLISIERKSLDNVGVDPSEFETLFIINTEGDTYLALESSLSQPLVNVEYSFANSSLHLNTLTDLSQPETVVSSILRNYMDRDYNAGDAPLAMQVAQALLCSGWKDKKFLFELGEEGTIHLTIRGERTVPLPFLSDMETVTVYLHMYDAVFELEEKSHEPAYTPTPLERYILEHFTVEEIQ